jgi:hypothetical protein
MRIGIIVGLHGTMPVDRQLTRLPGHHRSSGDSECANKLLILPGYVVFHIHLVYLITFR